MERQSSFPVAELTITLAGDGRIRLAVNGGPEHTLGVRESGNGWTLRWLGGTREAPRAILEETTDRGGALVFWSKRSGARAVIKPTPGAYDNPADSSLYGGRHLEDVLSSAVDILGEEVKAAGEPTYDHIVGLLPPIRGHRYQILGSPLSRGKVILWPDGAMTTQAYRNRQVIYDPVQVDSRTSRCAIYDGLLDDWMPVACYRLEDSDVAYDLLAFVLPEEYAVQPAPFVRLARYAKPTYDLLDEDYRRPTFWSGEDLTEAQFFAALDTCVRYWWDFEASLAEVELPEDRAWRWTKGCLALAVATFCDDHPKYGALGYAREEHDTFPPSVLTLAETAVAWGAVPQAKRYLSYYLDRIVRADGTFNYYGPSGTEYAQWLWLLNEVEEWDGPQPWITRDLPKVLETGRLLERLRAPLHDTSLRLIEIAAEADNRHESYTYFSNNLWAVVGLRSLSDLAARHGCSAEAEAAAAAADALDQDIHAALDTYTEVTDVGPLIPSWAGYPADMWTLSEGPPLPDDVPDWEQDAYHAARVFVPKGFQAQEQAPRQWIRENTYANYRYHLESLSARELDAERANALIRLRKERGGELLGMTRFMAWLDDWPVAAYARHLLTTDRIEEYLLLYYAHMAHHGNRETLTYYEQVTADGQVRAHDCVPSLLVTPIMTRWMLCFEPIGENALYLLRGIPRAWLEPGKRLHARGLVVRGGRIDLGVEAGSDRVRIDLSLPPAPSDRRVYVDCRLPAGRTVSGIRSGGDRVGELRRGGRLVLNPGTSGDVRIVLDVGGG